VCLYTGTALQGLKGRITKLIITLLYMAQNNRGGKSERGFAAMDPEKQREIASKGGKAAHAKGTAHEFNSKEAAAAGRKGGRSRSS